MKALYYLWEREWRRSRRSGLWYLGGALFCLVQGLFFSLVVSSMSGDQAVPISPLRWMWGGDLMFLFLFSLIIPVLLVKSFAEERQQQTWEQLLCTGTSPATIILSKYFGMVWQWTLWMLCLAPQVAVILTFTESTSVEVLSAWGGLWMVGCHWLALGIAVSCGHRSPVLSYAVSAVVFLLYLFVPLGRLIFPDPFYRVFFDTIDIRSVLERSSQGLVLSTDLIYVIGLIPLWLWWASQKVERERQSRREGLFHWAKRILFSTVGILLIYTSLYISQHRPQQLDLSRRATGKLSQEFLQLSVKFPSDIQITAVLPQQVNIETYAHGRDLILSFLQRLSAHAQLSLNILDPDVDLREMERLQQAGIEARNRIGFVLLEREGRQVVLSYHQWLSLGVMTVDSEARRYVREFHGEALLTRGINALTRQERFVRVLVTSGRREIDLQNTGPLGGSALAELLQQLGAGVEYRRPGIDEIDLQRYDLVLALDPRDQPTVADLDLLNRIYEKKIPILAIRSAIGYPVSQEDAFAPWGVKVNPHTLIQKAYPLYDEFTLPVHEMSNHPIGKVLQGQVLLFDRCRPISEGVPLDPRLVTQPLVRAEEKESIWGEWSVDFSQSRQNHLFDANDLPSPLQLAMAVSRQSPDGTSPAMILSGSRAPFENRFFYEVANRRFVFQCLDWLLQYKDNVHLPPSAPAHHKFNIPQPWVSWIQWGVLLTFPVILLLIWWSSCRRKP